MGFNSGFKALKYYPTICLDGWWSFHCYGVTKEFQLLRNNSICLFDWYFKHQTNPVCMGRYL